MSKLTISLGGNTSRRRPAAKYLFIFTIFGIGLIFLVVTLLAFRDQKSSEVISENEWKEYILPDASFKYPATWEVLEKIPTEYLAKPWGEEGWEEGKMFIRDCSGPILQNTHIKSTIIAIEIIKPGITMPNSCWSTGDYHDRYTRKVAFDTTEEIHVIQWKLGPAVINTFWQGDVLQLYSFNEFHQKYPNKNSYRFALVYQNDQDELAESTFEQIISTFRFSD